MATQAPPKPGVAEGPLNAEELRKINDYWHAALYLCAGMIYLLDNPLLKEPLTFQHIKKRLLGHWGSDPGQAFTWVHLNRMIKKYDLPFIQHLNYSGELIADIKDWKGLWFN